MNTIARSGPKPTLRRHDGRRLAVIVPNACDPDYRVVKQAQAAAAMGFEVRVFCATRGRLTQPAREVIEGVTYIRREWTEAKALKNLFWTSRSGAVPRHADPQLEKLQTADRGPEPGSNADRSLFRQVFSDTLGRIARIKALRPLAHAGAYLSLRNTFLANIEAFDPDIIHAHDGVSLPLLMAAARATGARTLFDNHELETHRNPPMGPFHRLVVTRIQRMILPRIDVVTTVSDGIADALEETYTIPRPKVIYNAPTEPGSAIPDRWATPGRSDLRTELGLPADTILLVYTGIATENRGLEPCIEALSAINAARSTVDALHFAIVGEDRMPGHDTLRRLIETAGLTNHVHLVEPVSAWQVAPYIASATACVIPIVPSSLSHQYAMPNKLFEGLAAKLPILASDLRDMGHFVREHDAGETFIIGDPQDFARALDRLLANPGRYLKTRNAVLETYGWPAQSRTLHDILDTLAERGRSPRG